MKILLIQHKNFGKEDILEAFTHMGHEAVTYDFPDFLKYDVSPSLLNLDKTLNTEKPDMVFSSNYSPNISALCCSHGIPYAAWVYDSPLVNLYSATLANPTNYVFIFDSDEYLRFQNNGVSTVYYLPLAANTARMDKMLPTADIRKKLDSPVSFVGRLYDEDTDLFANASGMSEYGRGYLDAMTEAQRLVSGFSFTEQLIKGEFLDELKRTVPCRETSGISVTDEYIYSRYFIDRRLTSIERKSILSSLSEEFDISLYTVNPTPYLPRVRNMGSVNAYSELPYVFKCSKINLNISLRSIHSGIPLRAMEIMGAHGFLLSNFQRDFLEYFEPGTDFVYYEDEQDLKDKCRFYLSNDSERTAIADNGYRKVRDYFSYEAMLQNIIDTIFG